MLIILAVVLFILILLICGEKGSKSIVTTAVDAIGILLMLFFIDRGVPVFLVTAVTCLAVTAITLFYQNEVNVKSVIAFWSVVLVTAITLPFLFWLVKTASASGFNAEQFEITDSNGFSRNIAVSMPSLQVCVMVVALLGVLIDTSVAITSSVYEIRQSSPSITPGELMKSSFTVGKDILSTSIHTIFYIYAAEYMTLMMIYASKYSFEYVINSKSLAGEFISVAMSGAGCCLIVPVTSILAARVIFRKGTEQKAGEKQ
jgi:uncharacterized membrane protein